MSFKISNKFTIQTAGYVVPYVPPPAPPPTQSAITEPHFKYNSVLVNGNGTNNGTNNTFLDSSPNNFTVTRYGTPIQGAVNPFGDVWGGYFGGTDYLTLTGTALGTGNFTVEMFVNLSSAPNSQNAIFSAGVSDGGASCILYVGSDRKLYFYNSTGIASSTDTIPLNTWTHIALVRSGSNVSQYINGALDGTGTTSNNIASTTMQVMRGFGGITNSPVGYVSNFRIVVGTSVYTSGFTPSTSPLTSISGTSLLTLQNNRFKDNSTNNFSITPGGAPKVVPMGPFGPSSQYNPTIRGGSVYFGGAGNYLQIPSGGSISGTGDFTVEYWLNPTPFGSGYQIPFANDTSTGVSSGINSNGTVTFGRSLVAVDGTTSNAMQFNAWNHFALVRKNGNVQMYVNGVSGYSASNSTNYNSGVIRVGCDGAGTSFPYLGLMSNLRVTKNTAVYVGNFTPPTAPLSTLVSSSALLRFDNAQVTDYTTNNNWVTLNNTKVTSSVKKFNSGSIYFDGSRDTIYPVDTSVCAFGTGDFTLEYWLYVNSLSNGPITLDFRPNGTNGNYPLQGPTAAGAIGWYINSADRITLVPGMVSTGSWHHIATCRSGTSTRVFVNGNQVGSTWTTDTTNYLGGSGRFGYHAFDGAYDLNGYMDDIRITKGVARYTASFTPPTASLPLL
jgi:hypothetical protein